MDFNDSQIDAIETLDVFTALAGEQFAPYITESVADENLKTLYEWGTANLPGGLRAFKEVGAYELAFRQTLKTLKRDPNWVSRADRNKQLQADFDALSAHESKQRYLTDPEFKRFVDAKEGL